VTVILTHSEQEAIDKIDELMNTYSLPNCLICLPIEHSDIQKWCACVLPSVFLICVFRCKLFQLKKHQIIRL
jgi:hypothetical protein